MKDAKLAFKVLAITQKIPAFLSVMGSTMIISSVLRSKINRGNMQQRLLCAMSCIDVSVSLVWLLTNFFIPEDYITYPWTLGNDASCKAQGFIVQFSISSILYNSCLSLYYLLIVKFNWKQRHLEKIEKWMHICPIMFGLATAIASLVLDVFHPANWDCWIAPLKDDDKYVVVRALQWAFFFGILWTSIILSSLNMFAVYLYVRKSEKKSSKWGWKQAKNALDTREGSRRNVERKKNIIRLKRSASVATQGKLYISAFVITWSFPTIVRATQLFGGNPPSWLIVCAGTMVPSQGFLNAIVYFRLRFNKCAAGNPNKSKLWVMKEIIRKNLFFWWWSLSDCWACLTFLCFRNCNLTSDGNPEAGSWRVNRIKEDDGNDVEPEITTPLPLSTDISNAGGHHSRAQSMCTGNSVPFPINQNHEGAPEFHTDMKDIAISMGTGNF